MRRWILLLAVAVLATFPWRLGASPLVNTEGLRAITADEMVTSGAWVVPRLYGQPYLAKPPLHYWTLALTRRAIGHTADWVWRVPSVLAHAALVLLVGFVSRRWFGPSAGVIAAGATIGLFALWSQALKADIDSLNTLASVAAAFGMLEMGCRRRAGAALAIGTGLAVGAMLLLKGPAGLPLVIGAIAGAAIACRTWAPFRRPGVWMALGIGALIFGAWALAAHRALDGSLAGGTPSGVDEVLRQLTLFDRRVLDALALPFTLVAYALPIALAIPLALSKAAIADVGPEGATRVRALVWTMVAALVIGVLARTNNPRYMYIVLPLVAPLAGVVGQAWICGAFDRIGDHLVGLVIAVATVAFVGMTVAFVVLTWQHGSLDFGAVAVAAISIVVGVTTLALMHRRHCRAALIGVLAILLLTVDPYAAFVTQRRCEEEPPDAAAVLRDHVGPNERVIAGNWVMTAPQLFHYAGVEVDYRPKGLSKAHELPEDRWIVFHEQEWERWRRRMRGRFDTVITLPMPDRRPVLARIRRAGDGASEP